MNEKVFVGWVPNLISLMPDHVLPVPLELLPSMFDPPMLLPLGTRFSQVLKATLGQFWL